MYKHFLLIICLANLIIICGCTRHLSTIDNPRLITIADGWAANSINAVIFRRNSIVSHNDNQYVAFYDDQSNVVLAKRKLGSNDWQIKTTQYKGNTNDAHNSISIMIDGDGYLHMAWDHHGNALRYCRSTEPGSLELTEKMPMTGKKENNVTYPEFYKLPEGDLFFFYRDGSSGRGDIMLNRYDIKSQSWSQVQDSFISGQDQRNAYWQATVDSNGTIHISWVWRESPDVASNHDMCYAKSSDGGLTWEKSTGEKYQLPITADSAEYARRIPQRSELINQTSMFADSLGRPYIATYFKLEGSEIPQYHLIYHNGQSWQTVQVSQRQTPFTLSGGGTRRIPISRPKVFADCDGNKSKAYMVFRDIERDNKVSLAICDDLDEQQWRFVDLTSFSVDQWEPTYDTLLWKRQKVLHLLVQQVGQGQGETLEDMKATPVQILEWNPGQSFTWMANIF